MGALRHLRVLIALTATVVLSIPASLSQENDFSNVDEHSSTTELKNRLTYLDLYLEKHPKSSAGYGARAQVLRWLGDTSKAFDSVNKAIELNPKSISAYQERGIINMQVRKQREAIQDLTKSIELGGNSPQIYAGRGSARLLTNDFKGAYDDADFALRQEPSFQPAFYIKGAAACRLGKYEIAVEYLSKAIETKPAEPAGVFFYRATAYEKMGLKDKAQADYAQARKLGFDGKKIEAEGRIPKPR